MAHTTPKWETFGARVFPWAAALFAPQKARTTLRTTSPGTPASALLLGKARVRPQLLSSRGKCGAPVTRPSGSYRPR